MINSLTLLFFSEIVKFGGVETRPVVGRVYSECPALVERLMRKTIDVGGLLKLLLDGGLDVRFHTFGA